MSLDGYVVDTLQKRIEVIKNSFLLYPLVFLFHRQCGSDVIEALKKREKCTAIIIDPGQDDENWKICSSLFQEVSSGGNVKSQQVPSLQYCITTGPIKGQETYYLRRTF
ncbi:hypothetical protein KUTeg_022498 [Tegillarca granosa]|uniref:Uncharacterized protein n=1 Tax=Tegillarca granosa TaxID=220873 RepID=A0ABQ9E6E6_TEGGR|nr:hypothetical protein KUTeg_022498 [Tegillarca granosa]